MSTGEATGSMSIGEVAGIILLISVCFFGYKIYNMLVDILNDIDELWQRYGSIQNLLK